MNGTMYTCWSLLQDVFNEYLDWWDCFCTTALQYHLLCSLPFSPLAALGMPSLKVLLEIALYHTQLQHHAFTSSCGLLQQCNSGSDQAVRFADPMTLCKLSLTHHWLLLSRAMLSLGMCTQES